MEHVDRKKDPLIQVVRTHQNNTDSAVLQTVRCLKAEVQREKKNKREQWRKQKKDGTGRGCMDNCHVT